MHIYDDFVFSLAITFNNLQQQKERYSAKQPVYTLVSILNKSLKKSECVDKHLRP